MALNEYGYLDAKVKEALVTQRKEVFTRHAEYRDLIAEGILVLEDKLMNDILTREEVAEMQEELRNLRKGEISEVLIANLKEIHDRNTNTEIHSGEPHKNDQPKEGVRRKLPRKTHQTPVNPPKPPTHEKSDGIFTFDDLRLNVEDRLQLEPRSQFTHERFVVKVIGYIKGASLLVTAPIGSNGLRLPLQEKEEVIMRSFSGKNAFAFVSTILGINYQTFEYLHLSIPDTIQGIKIR